MELVFSNKKEHTVDSYNMGEFQKYSATSKKLGNKDYILHDFIYVKYR